MRGSRRVSRKRVVERERFSVRDERGQVHEVVRLIEQIDATTDDDNETVWIDGLGRLQLASGGAVNKRSDTDYELVSLGLTATRI